MLESLPRLEAVVDGAVRPLVWGLHEGLGLSPNQVSLASFLTSLVAAGLIATGHLGAGLGCMALGQILDGVDGAIARRYGLSSPDGNRIDTLYDRLSEAAIFVGFAWSGLAPVKLVLLALVAILLLTTIVGRTKLDPGVKRFALYLGFWVPYSILFTVIFAVNLAGFVIGLLKADIQFQHRMDALGGDLDTVASRAAELEQAERQRPLSATAAG